MGKWQLHSLLVLVTITVPTAVAQDRPLRLEGQAAIVGRGSLTEAWGVVQVMVANPAAREREARVAMFFTDHPDVHYSRDLCVPAHSRVTTWLPVGPAPPHSSPFHRPVSYKLFERIDGEWRPVVSPETDRLNPPFASYRKREPSTALYDDVEADPSALLLTRLFRHARGLSEDVAIIRDRHLPPTPEAFDGIDQFVLASNRLAADPVGRQALRHWVLHGGTLWVLLDRVDPDVVAPILGDGQRFQVVDRTSLTALRLRWVSDDPDQAETRTFEQPVEMVRVLLSGSEKVLYDANGWPAAFSQTVGRGRVVFTTLGGPGWSRPRVPRDPPSRFENVPDLPIPLGAFDGLAGHLYPEPQTGALRSDELAPLLTAEIGYEIVSQRTAAAILIGFVLALLVLGLVLRRSRSPERVGLLGPVIALAAAGVFVAVGVKSRQAVPPTAGAAAIVEVAPETGEAAVRGLFAVYSPESGELRLGTDQGGDVELDPTGLEGQSRRRVQTDLDAWHWENVAYPAGVRVGPFRSTIRTTASAKAKFGPGGVEGKLTLGSFRNPTDAVLMTRAGTGIAVQLQPDGSFRATSGDAMPAGQYLSGAILSDRQQRHEAIYRRLFAPPGPPHYQDRDLLLVWTEAEELPFHVGGAERKVGALLLVVPIDFGRPSDGTVTIPSAFVACTEITDGRSHRPALERSTPHRMKLRFQLPPSTQTLTVEKATVLVRMQAPERKVTLAVSGTVLREEMAPSGVIRAEITDPQHLRPDATGGLFVELAIGPRLGADGREVKAKRDDPEVKWVIESLGLEIVGRK